MAAKEDSEVRQKQRRKATRTGVTETERIAQRYQRKSCSGKKVVEIHREKESR